MLFVKEPRRTGGASSDLHVSRNIYRVSIPTKYEVLAFLNGEWYVGQAYHLPFKKAKYENKQF